MNNTNKPHRPRKRFGQNFLKDHGVLQKIIDEIHIQPEDHIIEIGPGKGALTRYILSRVGHINVIEIDRDLIPLLEKQFDTTQITIHQADALEFAYQSLSNKPHDCRIVGNLPYNISTPLLFHLFENIHCIADMHFMLQKEVVERMTACVGDQHYNRLSVMTQYFCDTSYLFTVPPSAFDPAPKVESAIVRLTPKQNNPKNLTAENFTLFSQVVKEAFTYRRKQLGNSLKKLISADALNALDIDPTARPQTVSIDEFIRISNAISVK